MHNHYILSLLMGGMFGKTLAVFATPHFPFVRGYISEQSVMECNEV